VTTRCVYEVPGMNLFEASYQYTHSILRGVTFKVVPLSRCAISPQVQIFLENLLWNIFQWLCNILEYSEIFVTLWQLIFGNSQKSFGTKSEDYGVCFISVIDFLVRNCLTESALWAGALSWWRIQSMGQSSGLFLRIASRNHYSISI
jgi:hypothetical protein